MSELREQLKGKADEKLQKMIRDLLVTAHSLTEGTGISAQELCRIVSSPDHSKTLMNQSVSRLIRSMEKRMLEKMQSELENL